MIFLRIGQFVKDCLFCYYPPIVRWGKIDAIKPRPLQQLHTNLLYIRLGQFWKLTDLYTWKHVFRLYSRIYYYDKQ